LSDVPQHQIRAVFDDRRIRVYQAFNRVIAEHAVSHGTFVSPPFKVERMTWIKPSFRWMMYRAGWGYKDEGQERILAIDITREGFEWALSHSCPSHPPPLMTAGEWTKMKAENPVRIQWDPERDIHLAPLPYRSLQVGLSGEAVRRYIGEWIVAIADITDVAHRIHARLEAGRVADAEKLLPQERSYPYLGSVGVHTPRAEQA
jgi:hypothetical protein